jgi:hypothetical protein
MTTLLIVMATIIALNLIVSVSLPSIQVRPLRNSLHRIGKTKRESYVPTHIGTYPPDFYTVSQKMWEYDPVRRGEIPGEIPGKKG